VKFKKSTSLLMANIMVIAAFSMPTFAEEGESFIEADSSFVENDFYVEDDNIFIEENDAFIEDDSDIENEYYDEKIAFLKENDCCMEISSFQAIMPLSGCINGINHGSNGVSASRVISDSNEYRANWGFDKVTEIIKDNISMGIVNGQFEKRPILGDRVRTRVNGIPSTRCGVATIVSSPTSHMTEHARHGGNHETNWVSLSNNHASFGGIAYW